MAENIGQTESKHGKQDFKRQPDAHKPAEGAREGRPERPESGREEGRREMGGNRYDYPSKEVPATPPKEVPGTPFPSKEVDDRKELAPKDLKDENVPDKPEPKMETDSEE